MLKFYSYANCSTCKAAKKYLESRRIAFHEIPIRETPPTPDELHRMLKLYAGNLRRLFNTSGRDYKALGLGTRLDALSEEEALKLLSSNGNLVKRPFVLGPKTGKVGFRAEEWEDAFSPGQS